MSALGMGGTAVGRVLSSCLAGSREGTRSDLEEAGRGKILGLAGAGVSVVGTARGEKLSRHSHSPSKRHLWPGCPWRRDLGAELGTLGAGAEQTCPGPPEGPCYAGHKRQAGGPSAFVMLELFLNTLRHSPGSGASQLALSCLQISLARPIFLCCLWHRLKNLLQVLFALTLPVPSCSLSVGPLALGEAVCGQHPCPPPTSCPWVMCSQSALRHESLQPLPIGFISFAPCHQKCPPRGPLPAASGCLCPPQGCHRLPAQVP